MEVSVGFTLRSLALGKKIVDPFGAPPFPTLKIEMREKVQALPMLSNDCVEECVELEGDVVILKEGSHEKACVNCQEPWPRRWEKVNKYLVFPKVRRAEVIKGKIRKIQRGKLILHNKVVEWDRLYWTLPLPSLARLLNVDCNVHGIEGTLIVMEVEDFKPEWKVAYHLGTAVKTYAMVSLKRDWGSFIWAIIPHHADPYDEILALKRRWIKGKINRWRAFHLSYYALSNERPNCLDAIEEMGIILSGRTAEWREMDLAESLLLSPK